MSGENSTSGADHVSEMLNRTTLQHVRRNAWMYIGNTRLEGLQHLVSRLVSNSLVETRKGFGRSVRVAFHMDGTIEIADDGRTPELIDGSPSIEVILTSVQSNYWPDYESSREWFDYSVAAALSESLWVEIRQKGEAFRQEFQSRIPLSSPKQIGPSESDGLTLAFKPDPAIFGNARLSLTDLWEPLLHCAYLYSGVSITMIDEATSIEKHFEFSDGIRAFVTHLAGGREPIHSEPIVIRREHEGVRFEAGLLWIEGVDEILRSFANDRIMPTPGYEVEGVRAAVSRSLNDFIREHSSEQRTLTSERTRSGLVSVVSVRLSNPIFEGALRSRLISNEARRAVERGVGEYLFQYFQTNPEIARQIIKAAFARPIGPAMTEEEWQTCEIPLHLLRFIDGQGSRRQAILFVLACWKLNSRRSSIDPRGLQALEEYANGAMDDNAKLTGSGCSEAMQNSLMRIARRSFGPVEAARVSSNTSYKANTPEAAIVREIFGNPFKPVTLNPTWLTSTVIALAKEMYESQDFTAMPILSDALQDAGCDNEDILNHCRQLEGHTRGCWILDLLLSKS